MKIIVEATGGPMTGKTYMLNLIKTILEAKDFEIVINGRGHHEHVLVATRPDDWLINNLRRRSS